MLGNNVFDYNNASITIFNITSNQSIAFYVEKVINSIEIPSDGSVIFLATSISLQVFDYLDKNTSNIYIIYNASLSFMKLSKNSKLLAAYNDDTNQLAVLSI